VDLYGDATLSTDTIADAGHIYLTGSGWAVFIETDGGAFGGFGAAQTGSGSLSNSSLAGTFFGGTTEVINQATESEGTIVTLNGAPGAATITSDNSSTSSLAADQSSTDTISVNSDGTFTTASDPGQVVGVVIDSNYFLIVSNAGSSYPTVSLYGPGTIP
jgi:hypothetical protein